MIDDLTTNPAGLPAPVPDSRAVVPAAGDWMQHIALGRAAAVSADQVTALGALVAYVARARRTSEFRVERELADRFGVANVTCLPGSSFDDAIRYLADQAPAPAAA